MSINLYSLLPATLDTASEHLGQGLVSGSWGQGGWSTFDWKVVLFVSLLDLGGEFSSVLCIVNCTAAAWWPGAAIGRASDLEVAGSSPGWAPLRSDLGQATYTCVPLSPSSIICYQPRGWSLAGKVTAGLVESNGSLPPGLWLMSTVGWLPRNRDELRAQRLSSSMWLVDCFYYC